MDSFSGEDMVSSGPSKTQQQRRPAKPGSNEYAAKERSSNRVVCTTAPSMVRAMGSTHQNLVAVPNKVLQVHGSVVQPARKGGRLASVVPVSSPATLEEPGAFPALLRAATDWSQLNKTWLTRVATACVAVLVLVAVFSSSDDVPDAVASGSSPSVSVPASATAVIAAPVVPNRAIAAVPAVAPEPIEAVPTPIVAVEPMVTAEPLPSAPVAAPVIQEPSEPVVLEVPATLEAPTPLAAPVAVQVVAPPEAAPMPAMNRDQVAEPVSVAPADHRRLTVSARARLARWELDAAAKKAARLEASRAAKARGKAAALARQHEYTQRRARQAALKKARREARLRGK